MRLGFAPSNRPHLHRAYEVTICNQNFIAVSKKISLCDFPTFQGAVYATIVLGIQNCRVLFGPLPFGVCFFQLWLVSAIVWFTLIVLVLMYFLKFMFVCIWKRMRDMNDDLIVKIGFWYLKRLIF